MHLPSAARLALGHVRGASKLDRDHLSITCPFQKPEESFGMSIAGGLGSECGDLPIFVASVLPDGVIGRIGQVKVGG